MYLAGSWPACPRQRSETDSISVGPPPSRARSTASSAASNTSSDVAAVHADARHAVRDRALGDRRDVELERVRRGVGELVVVHDPHDRELVDRRPVERLVPPAVRRGAVAADRHRDAALALPLVGERRAARHGVGDGQVRDDGERPVAVPVADVAVAVASARVAVDPSPELRHHAVQVEALRQLRRQVAVRREQRVVLLQRERDADVGALLAAPGVDGAGEPALPVERLHALVEVPAELQEVAASPSAGRPGADARRERSSFRPSSPRLSFATGSGAACRRARGAPRPPPRTGSDGGGSARPPRPGPPPSS